MIRVTWEKNVNHCHAVPTEVKDKEGRIVVPVECLGPQLYQAVRMGQYSVNSNTKQDATSTTVYKKYNRMQEVHATGCTGK
jgi:hypothetical protein